MKSILMSIKPKHCANILNRLKTKEIRKYFPKDYRGWVYIYCTKNKEKLYDDYPNVSHRYKCNSTYTLNNYLNGKVIARFYCDDVEEIKFKKSASLYYIDRHSEVNIGEVIIGEMSCLNHKQLDDYLQEENGYAINISQLEVFDRPRELSEFYHYVKHNKEMATLNNQDWDFCKLTKAPQSWCYVEVDE